MSTPVRGWTDPAVDAPPHSYPGPAAPRRPPITWVPSFLALSAIWGSSFLFIKVADRALSPTEVALARVAVGALLLTMLCWRGGQGLPRGARLWGHLAVVAFVGNVLPFTLFAYGEMHISSVLAGIWNATTPLMVLLVTLFVLREERPTRERSVGLLIGFGGVICLLGPWSGLGRGALGGDLACLAAAALYGVSFPYTRRHLSPLGLPATTLAAGQLLCATAELALIVPAVGRAPGHITLAVLLSVLALGALGSGVAFVLSYRLIGLAGATTTATVAYVMPLWATALGIVVLGESLHWYEPVGGVVVLGGVAISQRLLTPAALTRARQVRRAAWRP